MKISTKPVVPPAEELKPLIEKFGIRIVADIYQCSRSTIHLRMTKAKIEYKTPSPAEIRQAVAEMIIQQIN